MAGSIAAEAVVLFHWAKVQGQHRHLSHVKARSLARWTFAASWTSGPGRRKNDYGSGGVVEDILDGAVGLGEQHER
jgi:hypothetical protein